MTHIPICHFLMGLFYGVRPLMGETNPISELYAPGLQWFRLGWSPVIWIVGWHGVFNDSIYREMGSSGFEVPDAIPLIGDLSFHHRDGAGMEC